MPIVNRVADLQPDIQAWRRDIHQHPELLYDVHRTAAFVAERLREFGCDEFPSARFPICHNTQTEPCPSDKPHILSSRRLALLHSPLEPVLSSTSCQLRS